MQLDDSFLKSCLTALAIIENSWFDPIEPHTSISAREVCQLHAKLVIQNKDKKSKLLSISYLSSLDMFLSASKIEDYENIVAEDALV